MQATETGQTSTARTHSAGGKSHHEAKFTKVCDGRKRAIRGLWKRNERFYAQLTVFDPITGKNRVQRISLLDKQGEPVGSVAQAVAVMGWMPRSGARRNLGITRTEYLHAISAGAGARLW